MNQQTMIHSLADSCHSFVKYMTGLTAGEYSYSFQQKWTAGQQLEHIVLCMKPILQVFSMDKKVIEQTFGKTDRQGLSYEDLQNKYKVKVGAGGKAPDRFIPVTTELAQRESLCETLLKIVGELGLKIEIFSDQELDSLQIPHPLLGNLTLREMLYNAIYHVKHHQNLAEINLSHK